MVSMAATGGEGASKQMITLDRNHFGFQPREEEKEEKTEKRRVPDQANLMVVSWKGSKTTPAPIVVLDLEVVFFYHPQG